MAICTGRLHSSWMLRHRLTTRSASTDMRVWTAPEEKVAMSADDTSSVLVNTAHVTAVRSWQAMRPCPYVYWVLRTACTHSGTVFDGTCNHARSLRDRREFEITKH